MIFFSILQISWWVYQWVFRKIRQFLVFGVFLTNAVITIAIRYDTTTIRLRRIARACFQFDASKKWTCQFFVVVVRIVVVSQLNRTHIVISITSVVVECVAVSSCRSRVVVESQLWYRLNGVCYHHCSHIHHITSRHSNFSSQSDSRIEHCYIIVYSKMWCSLTVRIFYLSFIHFQHYQVVRMQSKLK